MKINRNYPVIVWRYLEDTPSLQTLQRFFEVIPDEPLIAALKEQRGRGRNNYKIEWLWGVVLLTIALRHSSFEACLDELRRNPPLRLLLGMLREEEVPKKWNLSRFMQTLGNPAMQTHLRAIFDVMAQELGRTIPNLGERTAGDSTALSARRGQAPEAEMGLPPPTGGRKEYRDDQGRVTSVLEWFGYKLHLLVDSRHEVALAYQVTDTKTSDHEQIAALLTQAQSNLPAGRIQTMAYDKAADNQETHQTCLERGIKPVVEVRKLWQGEPLRPLPGQDPLPVPVYHDEEGTVFCHDLSSGVPVQRKMAHWGYEKDRQCIKYRCPAQMFNFKCGSESKCNVGKAYGLTVRLDTQSDPRRFPAIPRGTPSFRRLYRGRTSVERVNARLKLYWGADDGNVAGARRFFGMAGALMIVHLAFATVLAQAPGHRPRLGYTGLGSVHGALQRAAKTG